MSTVVLDTITGKSTATTITIGSTPVVSASANSMTIRGEGSAQTSIQQGLCKAWVSLTNDAVNQDSLNIASITDNGTGDYSPQINNNMNNALYACVTSADITDAVTRACAIQERATGSFRVIAYQTHAAAATESAVDGAYSVCLGDLA